MADRLRCRSAESLHRTNAPEQPADLRSMAAALHHQGRAVVVLVDDLERLPWPDRQHLENIGNRLYGKRPIAK